MGVKYNHHSDEEMCGASCESPGIKGEMACYRTKGHEGDHVAIAFKAGEADGVHWCCRGPLGMPHTDWCPVWAPND